MEFDLNVILVIALLTIVGIVIFAGGVIITMLVRITGDSVKRDTLEMWLKQGSRWALDSAESRAELTVPEWDDQLVESMRRFFKDAPGGLAEWRIVDPSVGYPGNAPVNSNPPPTPDFDGELVFGHNISRLDPDGKNERQIAVPAGLTYVADLGNPESEHGIHPDVHYIPETGFRFAISDRAGAFGYALPFVVHPDETVVIEVAYHATITPKPEVTAPLDEWFWFTGRVGNDPLAAKPLNLGSIARWEVQPTQTVSEIVVQMKVHQANAGGGSYVDLKTLIIKKKKA